MNEEFACLLTNGKQTKKNLITKVTYIKSRDLLKEKKKDALSTEIWNFVETWPTYLKYIGGG